MQNNFEPVYLKKANDKLDKHVLSAYLHKIENDEYKRKIFKESLWKKLVGLFKK